MHPALRGVRSPITKLRKTQKAFDLLARSCEEELVNLRLRVRPHYLRHGINTLPDDLLLKIFGIIVKEDQRYYQETDLPV